MLMYKNLLCYIDFEGHSGHLYHSLTLEVLWMFKELSGYFFLSHFQEEVGLVTDKSKNSRPCYWSFK